MEDVIEKGVQVSSGAQPSESDKKIVEHFSRTGTYRAEDVQRVLGDPRQGWDWARLTLPPCQSKRMVK